MSVCEFGNQRLDESLYTDTIKTTKDFYWYAGYSEYLALDVNNRMSAIMVDLNLPIDASEIGPFDLVTDNGTGEHLFDQRQVWENQHNLTKVGGVMLKIMPFTPWINHGFFNFNPILYRDVAAVNEYKWLFFWITGRDNLPIDLPHNPNSFVFIEKRPRELEKFIRDGAWSSDLYMVAAWIKTREKEFRIPLQGKYLKDIADDFMKGAYRD